MTATIAAIIMQAPSATPIPKIILPSGLRFAKSDTPQSLRDTFGAMMAIVEPFCENAELATEAFWATLHRLAELERHGRIRAAFRKERVTFFIDMFTRKS